MNIRRTIPPAASTISVGDFLRGLYGILNGKVVVDFEEELRKHFDTSHVFLVSAGKAALVLILSALHALTGRTKVIVPAYTCYSVPSAVVRAGLDVIPCDVSPETLDFDYESLEGLADRETLCVVSTHLFGIPSDISRVRVATEGKGIFIIEDAAQSMGVESGGKKLGTLGDAGFFSLGRGKNITCGSGGIILTSSDDVADAISAFHAGLERESFGGYLKCILEVLFTAVFIDPRVYWIPSGMTFLGIGESRFDPRFPNHRMNGFKAGLMKSWRSRLEMSNRRRECNGEYYMKELGLRNGRPIYTEIHSFLRFPFFRESPDFKECLCRDYGHLGISPMYPGSINTIEAIRERVGKGSYPGAESIARSLLTLPTHSLLTSKDRSEICAIVKSHLARETTRASA